MRKTQRKRRLDQKYCPKCREHNKEILKVAQQNFVAGYNAGLKKTGIVEHILEILEKYKKAAEA